MTVTLYRIIKISAKNLKNTFEIIVGLIIFNHPNFVVISDKYICLRHNNVGAESAGNKCGFCLLCARVDSVR